MELGQEPFRERILGVDRVEPDQLCNLVAGRQVLPGIDHADTQFAGERCAYRFLANHRLFRGYLCFGAIENRLRLVQLRSRAEIVADDLRDAITRNFGKAPIGLQCVQLGLVHLDVQLNQEFSLIDMLAGVEIDLANDPRYFGRNHHPARRRDGTDRLQRRLPALARDTSGGHHRRGRTGVGGRLFLHLQVLPSEHAAENECEKYQDYSQSFDQGVFARLIDIVGAPVALAKVPSL